MRKKLRSIIAVTVVFATAAGAIYWFLSTRHIEKTDNAYLKADSIVISPKISGYVAEVLVQDNQRVSA